MARFHSLFFNFQSKPAASSSNLWSLSQNWLDANGLNDVVIQSGFFVGSSATFSVQAIESDFFNSVISDSTINRMALELQQETSSIINSAEYTYANEDGLLLRTSFINVTPVAPGFFENVIGTGQEIIENSQDQFTNVVEESTDFVQDAIETAGETIEDVAKTAAAPLGLAAVAAIGIAVVVLGSKR